MVSVSQPLHMKDHEEEYEFWWWQRKRSRKNGDSTSDFHCLQTSLDVIVLFSGNPARMIAHRSCVSKSIAPSMGDKGIFVLLVVGVKSNPLNKFSVFNGIRVFILFYFLLMRFLFAWEKKNIKPNFWPLFLKSNQERKRIHSSSFYHIYNLKSILI